MKITTNHLEAASRRYAPAALGNGDLSILLDYEGIQRQTESGYGKLLAGIRRAGFRYDTQRGELISFGYLLHEMAGLGEPVEWEQSLDNSDGVVTSNCRYSDGTVIESTAFCHLERNILAVRRRIATALPGPYRLRYRFAPARARLDADGSGLIRYEIDGLCRYRGTVSLTADAPSRFHAEDGGFVLEIPAREFTFCLKFDDEATAEFDELLGSNRRAWESYRQESYIRIPSAPIRRMYETSQYHLRISSTRWSIPTGIYDSHWHGRYHAFDEYFTFMGLVTSGHFAAAAKIPHFRHSLLPQARRRIEGDRPRNPVGVAVYPWETNELCEENSPRGFWYDHIFHASHVALTAWECYRYSGDRELLRSELFPLIGASCEWLRLFHVQYDREGRTVIGCCTDLERLGPLRPNPFMTSCSVIAAFEAAATAAGLLGLHPESAAEWRRLAAGLRASLPHGDGRYLPYPGCTEHSIGQLAGIYPYGVLAADDLLQHEAFRDYVDFKSACGNMYQLGSGVCSWYLCWEAVAQARRGDGEAAVRLLEEVAAQSGCFGEMFEIYECGIRPWFTTAEGIFIQAVNELLLQFDSDGTPKFAPAVPAAWREFSFRLGKPGGGRLEADFREGRPVMIS